MEKEIGSSNIPLEVIWPRILVLSFWTERTSVSSRSVDETVPDHFVLPFETFSALPTEAPSYGTEVRPIFAMYICM